MTNSISSTLSGQLIADANPASKITRAATAPATDPSSVATVEAVSVSANAQISTKLLNAARSSDGINASAVAQTRAAIQNGTFNVTAEDLATSITASFKGRTP